ncbi:SoxR reducing system RseC family protein [bacterium]|nr:SoxR reducing system RseC family protein [bacterium]
MTKAIHIEHEGLVQQVLTNEVKVCITSQSACASCHSKDACTASDSAEKIIDVISTGFDNLQVGQKVIIQGQKSLGLKASLLAYIYPFFLVLATLVLVYYISDNEGWAGIVSLAILAPYYAMIKMITPRLKKTFSFTLKEVLN